MAWYGWILVAVALLGIAAAAGFLILKMITLD